MVRSFSRFLIVTVFVDPARQGELGAEQLVVAIQPTVASDKMLRKSKPLQQAIEKRLGGKTKVEIGSDTVKPDWTSP